MIDASLTEYAYLGLKRLEARGGRCLGGGLRGRVGGRGGGGQLQWRRAVLHVQDLGGGDLDLRVCASVGHSEQRVSGRWDMVTMEW